MGQPLRPRRVLVFAAALVATTGLLAVQRAHAETDLPFNPFKEAQVGDWSVFEVYRENGGVKGVANVRSWTVVDVTGDVVTIEKSMAPVGTYTFAPVRETYSKSRPPTIKQFLGVRDYERLSRTRIGDATCSAGGHDFAVERVSTRSQFKDRFLPYWRPSFSYSACLHRDVKASGLVRLVTTGFTIPSDGAVVEELAGFGTKEKTLWGKTPDELRAELERRATPRSGSGR